MDTFIPHIAFVIAKALACGNLAFGFNDIVRLTIAWIAALRSQ